MQAIKDYIYNRTLYRMSDLNSLPEVVVYEIYLTIKGV
jgi:hypothetical protein